MGFELMTSSLQAFTVTTATITPQRLRDNQITTIHSYTVEYSLPWVLLHEFGHAIGLRHSPNQGDIMFNKVQSTAAELNTGDIQAVQVYYGRPSDGEIILYSGNIGSAVLISSLPLFDLAECCSG